MRPTARGAVLTVACLTLVITLSSPLRAYIRETREVNLVRSQLAQQRADLKDLEERKARLKDPAYIEMLARKRLNYVYPGEIGFVVLGKQTATELRTVPGALVPNDDSPWYSKLWTSTKLADRIPSHDSPLSAPLP